VGIVYLATPRDIVSLYSLYGYGSIYVSHTKYSVSYSLTNHGVRLIVYRLHDMSHVMSVGRINYVVQFNCHEGEVAGVVVGVHHWGLRMVSIDQHVQEIS
jgi:hypothetical protein